MNSTIDFANNPFFIHDMDKLCAVCQKKLEKDKTHSLFAALPNLEPTKNALEVLATISNFNSENGPQNLCTTCFKNTAAAYKFQKICNKANEYIQNYLRYQEEMKLKAQENVEIVMNSVEVEENVTIDDTGVSDGKVADPAVESSHFSGGATRIKCKFCHKMYRRDYMSVHRRTHTGEKPYKCNICNKRFAQPTTLKLHEITHTDNRAYICKYCGKTFKLLRNLRCHERTHSGEKPYKCDLCDKSFITHSARRMHYLVHTKEKRYQCEVCSKSFGRPYGLTQHLVSHSDVKKHECHLCGNRFTQAHSLRTHLKMSCQALK